MQGTVSPHRISINVSTSPVAPPGKWEVLIFQAEFPTTITGISYELNLFNAVIETDFYTGELVHWMLAWRKADEFPLTNFYPDPVNGTEVFRPPENLIDSGWLMVDRTVSKNYNPRGPYALILGGGGGTLVEGTGTIDPIFGSYLDAFGNNLQFPSGGGDTIAKAKGKPRRKRRLQPGDQMWLRATYWNCQAPDQQSGANLLGHVSFYTKN